MGKPDAPRSKLQSTKAIYFLLLISIVFAVQACGVSLHNLPPLYPEYKAYYKAPSYSCFRVDCSVAYGYHDIQIDNDTYFISYMSYFSNGLLPTSFYPTLVWMDADNERLIKGAQEHVLYRAAELSKSEGAKYFAVLHKDDWNLISEWIHLRKIEDYPHYEPGAGIVIKLLHKYPSSLQSNDNRVYPVDALLQQLPERNPGLADYSKQILREELSHNLNGFSRWRSSVNEYDSLDAFETKYKALYGTEHRPAWPSNSTIETMVSPQTSSGPFELSISDRRLISPLRFLHECVQLAVQEGYEAFKVMNWTVEEHRIRRSGGRRYVWFRTKATIVLQHQKEPQGLEPVFVVDEIRKNVELGRVWP